MKRPRLCFIVESGTDVRLVEGLAERFELHLLARRIEGGVPISQPTNADISLELGPSSRPRFASLVWRRLNQRPVFDAVLVQGYALAALAANFSSYVRRSVPTFSLVCSPIERYYACRRTNPAAGKQYRVWEYAGLIALARLNARLSRHYVALSHYLVDLLRGHGCRGAISVIPVYGVDTTIFCPPLLHKAALRSAAGLPPAGDLLLFSSRVAPEKDSTTLLSAFKDLLADGRNVYLLHRSGGYREFLDAADRFGVIDRVFASDAVHPLDGLARDYQASDVCVQASHEEGLGFSVLESLACQTPVVAARVGGLIETVIDGQTGWTYEPGNPSSLARCLRQILDQREEAIRCARAGRRLVLERYERSMVFDELQALITSSCGSAAAYTTEN